MIFLPWVVETLSGWNCTPSMGNSRWRSAMMVDFARRAPARCGRRFPARRASPPRRRSASGSECRSSATGRRRRWSCRRAPPRWSCRASAWARGRRCRQRPRRWPGGRGRRPGWARAGATLPLREMADQRDRDAGVLRRAWAGRDEDVRRAAAPRPRRAIARRCGAHHLRAQLAHVLDQVVGERIVVVENEDHRCLYGSATAPSGKLVGSLHSLRRLSRSSTISPAS